MLIQNFDVINRLYIIVFKYLNNNNSLLYFFFINSRRNIYEKLRIIDPFEETDICPVSFLLKTFQIPDLMKPRRVPTKTRGQSAARMR